MRGCGEDMKVKVGKQYPLHVTTDCNSLHKTVMKDSFLDDKRSVTEVLVVREMITDKRCYEDNSDDESFGQRMKNCLLDENYHWGQAECVEADILTKVRPAKHGTNGRQC